MFHPVGSQSPAVYWRRRVALLGTVVVVLVLILVTAKVLFGGSGGTAAAQSGPSRSTPVSTPVRSSPHSTASTAPHGPTGSSSHRSSSHSSAPRTSPASGQASSSGGMPTRCTTAQLAVRALTDQASYSIGDRPKLMLQVTDSGTNSCIQDLADQQIELLVYNGASRVWGSHDCKVLPGVNDMTLVPGAPVRITIVWSGESSQPQCAGTRQLVGAGTYTLYAKLSGKTGVAAKFAIS